MKKYLAMMLISVCLMGCGSKQTKQDDTNLKEIFHSINQVPGKETGF